MTNPAAVQTAIMTRLARVNIFGVPARDLAATLDPDFVRSTSDEVLAAVTGGEYVPPDSSDGHLHPDAHLYPS